ncbi:uncharacterized protein LOC141691845 [Apium graveolens]|uniref:uncharacterized protein LOC141691845 n=1 Tax=Apium graveolens TaxID=4045 RepID=UPI003D7AE7B2
MATNRLTFTDLQNPLFMHPSDGPLSISVPKLQGAGDYRAWKRTFEIQLSAKRKLNFIDGSIARSVTNTTEASQWDTCNNLTQLEKRFSLTNGSRKYKLNKDLFSLKQNSMKLSEYFTSLSSLCEEIDSMNILPTVVVVTLEITKLLRAIEDIKEESKLFQFLNGLDETYGAQRSQLLMMCPLPSVEVACAMIQQEESQKEVL